MIQLQKGLLRSDIYCADISQWKGYIRKPGFKSSLVTAKPKVFNSLNKEIISNSLFSITLKETSTDQNKKWCVLLAQTSLICC